MKAVVVAADMITPYGQGVNACWEGLVSGATAISPVTRFITNSFTSSVAGTIGGLKYHEGESLVMQMLGLLFRRSGVPIPRDAKLILATTKGEIDFLEMSVLGKAAEVSQCSLDTLLAKVEALSGARGGGQIVSAACTSSAAAAARAAAMIRTGQSDCVLVVACDSVTEFIYAGFSALMALDKIPARPFDRSREGLNVGEAAAYALFMSPERAAQENRTAIGELAGWGLSDDANHMTGPSRESEGLILAISKALASAERGREDIGIISAHGTGTLYNDAMEMRAFHRVFSGTVKPVYSLKGGIGHTMGAAGLLEMIIALRALREKTAPPTVNLREADDDAAGWVSQRARRTAGGTCAIVTNAGFSGVNTALVVSL
ncbi:MAG TPA: beta-ketoacyl synthase N-terminal-like domain-containing protein [Nitrospirota bacterium]|nr:beta-ketoacyl synthase N-terminal-like domain-containing protein [Nitrospirota bacterium]